METKESKSNWTVKGLVRWALTVAFNGAAFYFAAKGNQWAANMIPAYAALEIIIALLAISQGNALRDKLSKGKAVPPASLNVLLGIALFLGYAALGWYFTAFALFLTPIIYSVIYSPLPEAKQEDDMNELEKTRSALRVARELIEIQKRELDVHRSSGGVHFHIKKN